MNQSNNTAAPTAEQIEAINLAAFRFMEAARQMGLTPEKTLELLSSREGIDTVLAEAAKQL